jgi:hypothetical protein
VEGLRRCWGVGGQVYVRDVMAHMLYNRDVHVGITPSYLADMEVWCGAEGQVAGSVSYMWAR